MTRIRKPVNPVPMFVGDKVKFLGEEKPYTVRTISPDGRWVILTRPHHDDEVGHIVRYTIIDFAGGVRGPDDRVFSRGYETVEAIAANLADLIDSPRTLGVSVRYAVALDIEWVRP